MPVYAGDFELSYRAVVLTGENILDDLSYRRKGNLVCRFLALS
jgi:hypothetical protein